MCGGCGAKVAPEVLRDLIGGPGDDAAVIETGGVRQVLSTDHLRAFTADHGLMARIAALHALGDIWAMGARPQAALVSVTLPQMNAALQARSLAEIMTAARDALETAGARIVGGHSSMGAEASLGVALTGLVEGEPITLAGARPGDALILTRGIGSGTLLAAEMRGAARGRDIAALFDRLAVPQGDAAAILEGAHAMTDVTGFGLAGHLWNICRASVWRRGSISPPCRSCRGPKPWPGRGALDHLGGEPPRGAGGGPRRDRARGPPARPADGGRAPGRGRGRRGRCAGRAAARRGL